jgi:hypothetical protein
MTLVRRRARASLASLAPLIAVAIGLASATPRQANADDPDAAAKAERCASRLSLALLGKSPSDALRGAADPQSQVDAMLTTPELKERFARYVNASFNRTPGNSQAEDAPYWLAKTILDRGKPWRDLFVGPYDVVEDKDGKASVTDSLDGLGYFRSVAWQRRYAGNELTGLKISTAYRMAQNTIALKLVAVTNEPGVDISAAGRAKAPCKTCHQDEWYALDKLAAVLTRKNSTTDQVTFDPPQGGPQQVLGGLTVKDDKELVTALVDSDAFKVRQCRLAWSYLYGRDENTCEAPIFDKCMSAFSAAGTIQSAIATIAKDPSFCQ